MGAMISARRRAGKPAALGGHARMRDDAAGVADSGTRWERELPEPLRSRATRLLGYAVLALAAVLAPLGLAKLPPAWLGSSYGRSYAHFELLGACGALALLGAAACELRRRANGAWTERLPVVLPLLVLFHFLLVVSEHSRKPFDYDCYEYAGRAILAGENPYQRGLLYLYPPLTGQLFAQAHRGTEQARALFGLAPHPEAAWGTVFYLYQCAQLLLVGLAYALALRFARGMGLATLPAHWLVAGLLVFDHALLRTLRHGQLNLWVLDLALLGVLLARRRPALAGVAIAFAAHLKLYPLILLVPLAFDRAWRAIAWTLAGLAGIALVASDFGHDLSLWEAYLGFLSSGVRGEIALRNNSLHALFFNLLRLAGADPRGSHRGVLDLLVGLASLALLAWFLVRVRRRTAAARGAGWTDGLRARAALASAADALAFALLLSPSAWEHHFVLAIPLAIAAVQMRWATHPAAVAFGIFLVLALPSLDLFLLGHHRMAGVLLLLLLTPSGESFTISQASSTQAPATWKTAG
jgi:hypothetical protein